MVVDRFKGLGELVEESFLEQSFNTSRGFGVPVDKKNYIINLIADRHSREPNSNEGRVKSIKEIAGGTIIQRYYAGNESDQYRVYISLMRRAYTNEKDIWVAEYPSYRALTVEAFGTKDPTKDQIKRAKYALKDLVNRTLEFRGSLKELKNGSIVDSDDDAMFAIVSSVIWVKDTDGKKSLKVSLPDKLMEHHTGPLTITTDYNVLVSFKDDQFTRQLYQYLMTHFHKRKTTALYARRVKTFLKEFGLYKTNSVYEEYKHLKVKLRKAVEKINEELSSKKYKYTFAVRFDHIGKEKIEFFKVPNA